jgi:hypothetical protein
MAILIFKDMLICWNSSSKISVSGIFNFVIAFFLGGENAIVPWASSKGPSSCSIVGFVAFMKLHWRQLLGWDRPFLHGLTGAGGSCLNAIECILG